MESSLDFRLTSRELPRGRLMVFRPILFVTMILLTCSVQVSATTIYCDDCIERTTEFAWTNIAEVKGPGFNWYLNGREGGGFVERHYFFDWISIASSSPFKRNGFSPSSEDILRERSDNKIYPIPEPLTLSLVGVGLLAMGAGSRRRKLNSTNA